MTTDWMPPCKAARVLDEDIEQIEALVAAGVLDQRSICGDHEVISVRSVDSYLAERAAKGRA